MSDIGLWMKAVSNFSDYIFITALRCLDGHALSLGPICYKNMGLYFCSMGCTSD